MRVVVIGAGAAGLTVAIGLSRLGRDVVLVESGELGGDCTNVGCVPSKALLHAAAVGHPDPFGHARAVRDRTRAHDAELVAGADRVELVRGRGRLAGSRRAGRRRSHVVEVELTDGGAVELVADHVVVCTGSRPVVPEVDGLGDDVVLTDETVFELDEAPGALVIVGGGPLGIEMATALRDLGARVDLVERADRLLATEDPLVSEAVAGALGRRGVGVHLSTSLDRVDGRRAHLGDGSALDGVDRVLLAVGRRPATSELGLEGAGVELTPAGVAVDSWGRTSVDGVWAVGDVTGATATTHGASSIARRCVRALALPLPTSGAPPACPSAVYGRPAVASVGLSLDELGALPAIGRTRRVVDLTELDRGRTDALAEGVLIVDAERATGAVLRASIVGPAAPELIGLFTMAIDHGIGLRRLFGMVHPYPSWATAVGELVDDFAQDTYRSLPRELLAMVAGRALRRSLRRPR